MKNKFTREEIFIIKATKSHYDKHEKGSGYEAALAIISQIIYGTNRVYFENAFKVLTELLLKTRDWTGEEWNMFYEHAINHSRRLTRIPLSTEPKSLKQFEADLISFLLAKVQNIRVRALVNDSKEWIELINLDTTTEEDEKVRKAIESFENFDII